MRRPDTLPYDVSTITAKYGYAGGGRNGWSTELVWYGQVHEGEASVEGTIRTRYYEPSLARAVESVMGVARTFGLRVPADVPLFYEGDGEDPENPPPEGWRNTLRDVADQWGFRTYDHPAAAPLEQPEVEPREDLYSLSTVLDYGLWVPSEGRFGWTGRLSWQDSRFAEDGSVEGEIRFRAYRATVGVVVDALHEAAGTVGLHLGLPEHAAVPMRHALLLEGDGEDWDTPLPTDWRELLNREARQRNLRSYDYVPEGTI